MLLIYDEEGSIIVSGTGFPEPVGIPFMHVEEKPGHYIERVDVSVEPHVPVYKEYPKSEIQMMKDKDAELEVQNEELAATVEEILTDVIPSMME